MGRDCRNALPGGYQVHWYELERVLGQGGFGITYLARDRNLNQPVAVKEYFPLDLAARDDNLAAVAQSARDAQAYGEGLRKFVTEAQTLARFDHPHIVRVLSVFEANGTASDPAPRHVCLVTVVVWR